MDIEERVIKEVRAQVGEDEEASTIEASEQPLYRKKYERSEQSSNTGKC